MKPNIFWPTFRQRAVASLPAAPPRDWALPALFAIALPLLWLGLLAAPPLRVDVGEWGDHAALTGVNGPERSATETYRWTTGSTELRLPNLNSRYRLLRVRVHGWRPAGMPAPRLQIAAEGRPIGEIQTSAQVQTYELLLPPNRWAPERRISLISDAFTSTEDQRRIGVALDWAELRQFGGAGAPAAGQFAGQALLLALALLLVGYLRLPRAWARAIAAGLALGLLAANARQPLWVGQPLAGWLLVLLALLAATALARPRFVRALAPWLPEHQAMMAWALFAGALALRLLGAVHPQFDMHDLPFHLSWLRDVAGGQVYIYSTPSEYQNRPVMNPPAGYLLLMPLQLLALSPRLAIQVGVALADALGGLALLALARELGLCGRAALLATALYWALPINTTMLWWGFATNALAQPAGLLLAWLLLRLLRRPGARAFWLFAAACAGCMLLHIGALLLLLALLGAALALGWRAAPRTGRWAAVGAGALALALVGAIYVSAAWVPGGGRAGGLAGMLAQGWAGRAPRLGLVSLGALRGFLPLPLALAPLGMLLALRGRHTLPLGRALLLGWLGAVALFLGVYLGFGLVVRFVYFAAPPICVGLGALLSALWARRGRTVALALVLMVAWAGAALWVAGVLMRVKPSALPLTY